MPEELGSPANLIIPERWKRDLPPLPSALDIAGPVTFLRPDGVYWVDRDGTRRVSEPLEEP